MVTSLTLVCLGLANLASTHVSRADGTMQRCGAPDPSQAQVEAAQLLAVQEVNSTQRSRTDTITIDTYFHIVASSEKEEDGYISDKAMEDQIKVLNDNFAPAGFSFDLLNTTRTVHPTWAVASPRSKDEADMKAALRRGPYSALNVYYVKAADDLLGYCYFPVASPGGDDLARDGCTVLAATAPGGSNARFNQGKTTTHEVGHWMGLFHTFQGGCADGDEVKDTPAQSSPSDGCPVGRDSCPGGGVDPIHNYMDYSDDPCYEEFTLGQHDRMHSSWEKYRA